MNTELIIDCSEPIVGQDGDIIVMPSGPIVRYLPPPPLTEAKSTFRFAIDSHRDAVFAQGFTPKTGPLAGKTLQARNVEDRTNWLTSQAAYSAAVASGLGSVVDATFRTADNETITCTYAQGLQTLLAMADWGKTVMGASWALKDAVEAAVDLTALSAIDLGAGWP